MSGSMFPKTGLMCMRFRKAQGRMIGEDLGPAIFVDLVGDHGW